MSEVKQGQVPQQLVDLRALWMERAKKLRKDPSYTDCAVTLESCADELSSVFHALAAASTSVTSEPPAVVCQICAKPIVSTDAAIHSFHVAPLPNAGLREAIDRWLINHERDFYPLTNRPALVTALLKMLNDLNLLPAPSQWEAQTWRDLCSARPKCEGPCSVCDISARMSQREALPAEFRELSEAATPGVWFVNEYAGGREIRTEPDIKILMFRNKANTDFIVACVNYVRAALARAEKGAGND